MSLWVSLSSHGIKVWICKVDCLLFVLFCRWAAHTDRTCLLSVKPEAARETPRQALPSTEQSDSGLATLVLFIWVTSFREIFWNSKQFRVYAKNESNIKVKVHLFGMLPGMSPPRRREMTQEINEFSPTISIISHHKFYLLSFDFEMSCHRYVPFVKCSGFLFLRRKGKNPDASPSRKNSAFVCRTVWFHV